MYFKNLMLYQFPTGVVSSVDQFAAALSQCPLRDVGPLESLTAGFVSPLGRNNDQLVVATGSFVLFALGANEKSLPASVLADELEVRIAEIAMKENRQVGARERKRIREDIVTDFLPRAFTLRRVTYAYIDLDNGWLVVNASSKSAAEVLISAVRDALGSFPCTPLSPENAPRIILTDWLIRGFAEKFSVGDECELRDPVENGAIVRCRRQDLETDEVREHLKTGKQVFGLGVEFDDRLSFTLGEDLSIKKLRFHDVVTDGISPAESVAEEVAARLALMTLEVEKVLEALSTIFVLNRPTVEPPSTDASTSRFVHEAGNSIDRKFEKFAREHGSTVTVESGGIVVAHYGGEADSDPFLKDAISLVQSTLKASISHVQRNLGIGYNRAARLIEHMETLGIVTHPDANGSRGVLPANAATEKVVRLSAKLYATRDAARSILRENYHPRMGEYGNLIVAYAKEHGVEEMSAALALAKQESERPNVQLFLLAAVVELSEPSQANT